MKHLKQNLQLINQIIIKDAIISKYINLVLYKAKGII